MTSSPGPTSTPAEGSSTSASVDDLIVYSGRNENFVTPVIDAFTAATGVEVSVRYGDGTSDLAATLLNEGETTDADVFWAQDPAWIGAIGDQGLLAELPSDILGLVAEPYQDGDGRWVGVTARSRVLVYNPDLVTEDELPQSVSELVEPEWNGRLGIAPGNASFIAFVSAMELADGPEATLAWLERIASNDVQTYDGNGAIVDSVIAGDLDAGLVNHYYLLQRIADQGEVAALNHFFAPGDTGALVMATGVGVLAASDNQEAANEFIRHLLSSRSQQHFAENLFEYGLIEGAPTPEGQVPLADLAGPDIDLSDLADHLDTSVELIAQAGLS
ncbi:MAG TPA: extracellular solute-binding protein [Acidimicrobiia bacterium]|nr:extracellular solute-binding protein [Acidimicrobiia bacterium]